MRKLGCDYVGQDHVDWYMEKNPSASVEDAIGFALFQCEMNIAIRASIMEAHPTEVLHICADLRFSDEQKLAMIAASAKRANQDAANNQADLDFIERHACFRSNVKYSGPKDRYEHERQQRARAYQGDKRAWFSSGLDRKKVSRLAEATV